MGAPYPGSEPYPTLMRSTRFQQLLSALFLLAALLIAANAWLAFHAEEVLANSERWVTHTLEVITNLERVLHTAADAESSARGFLLTGQEYFLAPYKAAANALPAQFELLEHLTSDNALQVEQLQQTAGVARQRMVLLASSIQMYRDRNRAGQAAMLGAGEGQDLRARLVAMVQSEQQRERLLLAERLRDSAHARTEAKLTVALASSLDILFVILSLSSLSYERRLRQRAAEFSARLEKLQAITEIAFTQLSVGELTRELLARLRVTAQIDSLVLSRWHGNEIELVAAEGVAIVAGERRAVGSESAMAEVARTGRALRLTGDQLQAVALEALPGDALGLGSALILPMTISSKVIAVLVAGRQRGAGFSADDEELLSLAADRIAVSLDRAAAYEAERSARQLAEASTAQIQLLNDVLEERVHQRTAELETTNRELEAFSYSVSHDLRAPLRSVDGFSVALAEDYGHLLEGDGKHYLTRIRVGVQRMGQLIDAMLQLSRITRAEFSTETVDLSALAGSVADEIAQALPDRAIAFAIEPGLLADGDPRLLRVIFENMFGNAAKFTGKTQHAQIAFGWSAGRKAYFIRDNGAGFDQQYAGKLFVAFQRLHGDRDFQGSGIGLATVARVIRRHHGTIQAEGIVGKGAAFWFTLGQGNTTT